MSQLRGRMLTVALAVVLGIVLGSMVRSAWFWLALSVFPIAMTGVMLWRKRNRGVWAWGLVSLVLLSAGWFVVRSGDVSGQSLPAYVGEHSQLARVRGEVVEVPNSGSPRRGAFAAYAYEPPSTKAVLQVSEIEVDDSWTPVRGRLHMRIDQADYRIQAGKWIEAFGWLGAIRGPRNLGEFDYRGYLAEQGIVGRLTLRSRDNWTELEASGYSGFDLDRTQRRLRQVCADKAVDSLRIGLDDDTPTLGLLETMLLGRKDRSSSEVRVAFRQVGLAHLLSISGAHLGILLGLVWLVARWFVPHPPRAGLVVLVVLLLYLMAVPLRVPIVRSAIMAAVFGGAYATGRSVKPMQALSLAMTVVLLWRPADLFSPGFQLSFSAVAGLILFVQPVSDWLWPKPEVLPEHVNVGWVIGRWCVNYLSVSLVAFAVVAPLVAYHFQMVNPLAVLLSVMALPVLTAVLGVGYLKILIGLLLPSAGLLLSGPLAWLGDTLRGLVDHASDWPGAAVMLTWRPGVAWVFGMSGLVLAVFAGQFAKRRGALVGALVLMAVWTGFTQLGSTSSWQGEPRETEPAALLTMFAVGDGSCYLLELPGHTIMFDCGSQQYFDIAQSSILPALKQMGITRIDTLILSHADLDHYCGSLDLADHITFGRVLMPPQLLAVAEADPGGSTAFLVDGLNERGLVPRATSRGWSQTLQDTQLDILWPPADFAPKRDNDTSILLSVNLVGKRLLLNGDIADEAITNLLALEDLSADITDLPHHGSVVESSPAWVRAVDPDLVLQSSGRTRLYQDPWPEILEGLDVERLVTARDGMVQVRIDVNGGIEVWALGNVK